MRRMNVCHAPLAAIAMLMLLASAPVQAQETSQTSQTREPDLDVPYVPTPPEVVDRMLDMAGVGPADYVIDLGSGDGRIVIEAVERGAFGHGIDIDPARVKEARDKAREAGVTDRVNFLRQDLFETDMSQASVVTMYLLSSVNEALRPKLLDTLRPGTRVVSHSFDMDEWRPDRMATIETPNRTHRVYYWVVPANASGQWQWNVGDREFTISVDQTFQRVNLSGSAGDEELQISDAVLHGRRIGFTAQAGDQEYVFSGRIEGDRIRGTMHVRQNGEASVRSWTAQRPDGPSTQSVGIEEDHETTASSQQPENTEFLDVVDCAGAENCLHESLPVLDR